MHAVRLTVEFPDAARTFVLGERLVSLDPLQRGFGFRTPRLQDVEYSFTVADPDNDLGALAAGALAWELVGSAVTREVLVGGAWETTFVGVLDRDPELVGPSMWKLSVRPDDLALGRSFPRTVLSVSEFPRVDTQVTAQYGPHLYGEHNSLSVTNKGMVPLPLIDATAHDYMVCWGWARSVIRVYGDGSLISPTPGGGSGGWIVVHPLTPSGRLYTAVRFTADQAPKVITADAQGYETVGDGTGTLIANGAEQLAHAITNWMFGDYRSGPWLPQTRIDSPSFARVAAYLARYASPGSSRRIFGDQMEARALLDEWGESHDARLFWTAAGKIGAAVIEPQTRDLTAANGHVRWDEPTGQFAVSYTPDFEDRADRLDVQFCYSSADGKYLRSVAITDPTLNLEAGQSFELPWSPAFL